MNAHYSGDDLDIDLMCVLYQTFEQKLSVVPVAAPPEITSRGRVFALQGLETPLNVWLLRYPRGEVNGALRTFHALQALQEVMFPAAPRVFYFNWAQWNGEALLMLEYHPEGRFADGHPLALFARTGPDFATTLARLHQIPWSTLPELPCVSPSDVLRTLRKHIEALRAPRLRELYRRLWEWESEIQEQPYSLVHGHYTLEHIVALQTHVIAIYGWEQAALGDARLDFGYTCAYLSAHRLQMVEVFADAYIRNAGPVQDARFWNALGGLRLLVELSEKLRVAALRQDAIAQQALHEQWHNVYTFTISQAGIALP